MRFTLSLKKILFVCCLLATSLAGAQSGSMHELTPDVRVWLPTTPKFKETDNVKYFTASDVDYFQIMLGLEMEDDAFTEIDTIETRYDKVLFYKKWCLKELWDVDSANILYSDAWYISRYQGYQYAFRSESDAGKKQIWAARIVLYKDEPLVFYATVGDNQAGALTLDKFFDSIQLDWDGVSDVEWKEIHKGSHSTAVKLAEDIKAWTAEGEYDDFAYAPVEYDQEEEEIIVADTYHRSSVNERAERMADDIKDTTMMFMQIVGVLGFLALVIFLVIRHKRIQAKREYDQAGPSQPNPQPNPAPEQMPNNTPDERNDSSQGSSDHDRWRPQ